MVHRFDVTSTTQLTISSMLDHVIPLHVYTDLKSRYNLLNHTSQTAESFY